MSTPSASPLARSTSRTPVIFLAHGSPMLLEDAVWMEQLRTWGRELGPPRALLMVSAHWVERPVTLGATRTVPLVYDFYGFPPHYYSVKYAAPGAPALAEQVRSKLAPLGPVRDSDRGLDHGAYIPLLGMYPSADVPVLQVSLPSLEPRALFEVGRALAPLRDEGVLIVGSGFLTHNLAALDLRPSATPPSWATEFDAWAAAALGSGDADALIDYRARAPGLRQALPTHEHFVPVLVAAGAAAESGERPTFPIEGYAYGSMTKRSVQWGRSQT